MTKNLTQHEIDAIAAHERFVAGKALMRDHVFVTPSQVFWRSLYVLTFLLGALWVLAVAG